MTKQKLLSLIFTVIFITVFSIFNFHEYKNFHVNKNTLKIQNNEIQEKLQNFKLEDIKQLEDIEFYYTPNKDLLSKIIQNIENAKKHIYLETYMLTEKRIQAALIKAHKK
jgi:phosphatidylserine/phosphatidylglycerophosphate/cardiolipin synthase-like enzyme